MIWRESRETVLSYWNVILNLHWILDPVDFSEPFAHFPQLWISVEREGLANNVALYWNSVTCEIVGLSWDIHCRLELHRGFYICWSTLSVEFVFWLFCSLDNLSGSDSHFSSLSLALAAFNMPPIKMNISIIFQLTLTQQQPCEEGLGMMKQRGFLFCLCFWFLLLIE